MPRLLRNPVSYFVLVLLAVPASVLLTFVALDALGANTSDWSATLLIALVVVPAAVGWGLGRLTDRPLGDVVFATVLSLVMTFLIAVTLLKSYA